MKTPGRPLAALGVLTIWLLALGSALAVDPPADKVLYLVATAHLDDQWNWTIQDADMAVSPTQVLAGNPARFLL